MSEITKRRVDVTAATFFRLLGVVILVWVWLRLWQWIMIFVAAVFLAIALDPLVKWLDGRGIRRRFAGPLVVLLLALVLAGFFYFSGSELKGQAGLLGDRINETQRQIGVQIPDVLKQLVPSDGAGCGSQGSDRESAGYLMRFGRALLLVPLLACADPAGNGPVAPVPRVAVAARDACLGRGFGLRARTEPGSTHLGRDA